jgi:hypothetical protein
MALESEKLEGGTTLLHLFGMSDCWSTRCAGTMIEDARTARVHVRSRTDRAGHFGEQRRGIGVRRVDDSRSGYAASFGVDEPVTSRACHARGWCPGLEV